MKTPLDEASKMRASAKDNKQPFDDGVITPDSRTIVDMGELCNYINVAR